MSYTTTFGTQEEQVKNLQAKGYKIYRSKLGKSVAAVLGNEDGSFFYKVWQGKAAKPCAHYKARSAKNVEESVAYYFKRQQEREEAKQSKKAIAVVVIAADHFEVGDVVSNSWGYNQTNVDFYQVVRVLNKQIELQEILQNSSDRMGGASGGQTQPRRFEFVEGSKPFRKPVRVYQHGVSIPFTHGSGSKWNGKALYTSSCH